MFFEREVELLAFNRLIDELKKWPGINFKNVQKIALSIVRKKPEEVARLCDSIVTASQKTILCKKCFALTETEVCAHCVSEKYSPGSICVVSSWLEHLAIKDAFTDYKGQFHVLGGVLSPLEGVSVSDLFIDALVNRLLEGKTSEVIFALSPTPEGEVTVSCIVSWFNERNAEGLKINFFKIASGIPIGSVLENADRSTLSQALAEKKQL